MYVSTHLRQVTYFAQTLRLRLLYDRGNKYRIRGGALG